MRSKLFLVFAAAVSLAGCSTNEEVLEISNQRDLNFSTFVDKVTKAPGSNLEAFYQDFGVWGYYTALGDASTAWMNVFNSQSSENASQLVTYDIPAGGSNKIWSYSPVQKWIPKQEYRFYAYAPFYADKKANAPVKAVMTQGANNGVINFADFTINGIPAAGTEMEYPAQNQLVDLMVSTGHARSTSNFDNSAIDLNFKHMLTNVNVVFKTTSLYDVTITSVKLHGVKVKGAATVTLSNANNNGIVNANPAISWEASYPITLKGKTSTTPLQYKPESEFRAMENLYMIPQDFDNGALTLEVSYTVGDPSENNDHNNTFTKNIPLATTAKAWTPGVRITYTLIINTGNNQGSGTEIGFGSPTTSDWNNADGIINQD
ncbi:MAG: fimbrillin family protein [Bacteroidales bacterium]